MADIKTAQADQLAGKVEAGNLLFTFIGEGVALDRTGADGVDGAEGIA